MRNSPKKSTTAKAKPKAKTQPILSIDNLPAAEEIVVAHLDKLLLQITEAWHENLGISYHRISVLLDQHANRTGLIGG